MFLILFVIVKKAIRKSKISVLFFKCQQAKQDISN